MIITTKNDLLIKHENDWDIVTEDLLKTEKQELIIREPRKPYKRNKSAWVKKTEKFIRYKIFNIFKYNPRLKTRNSHGKILYIYEHPDKLVFKQLYYYINADRTRNFTPSGIIGVLKHKNGRFNFYIKINGKWKNASNCWSNISASFYDLNIKLIHLKRVVDLIEKFARRFNKKLSILKERPSPNLISSSIIRLCYPALDYIAPQNYKITFIDKNCCRYLRGKTTSKFIKSLKTQNSELNGSPRYFKWIYMSDGDPLCLRNPNFEYIKIGKKIQFIDKDNGIYIGNMPWDIKRCEEYIRVGKFKEIPPHEAALMK